MALDYRPGSANRDGLRRQVGGWAADVVYFVIGAAVIAGILTLATAAVRWVLTGHLEWFG